MKRFLTVISCLALSAGAFAQPKLNADNIPEIVKAMTTEEKARFVVGVRFNDPPYKGMYLDGTGGVTYPIPRLGIPSIVMMDGPVGVRQYEYPATSFPTGLLTAATWDREIAGKIGEAIGEESLSLGNDVILGPGMNILRNPLNGRNFEYFSEDPVLTGMIAAAYVNGVQSKGVGTSAKHFAANSQETNRYNSNSRVSERALREIYLRGFEIAVRESRPRAVMTSYNLFNGVHTSERRDLIENILRAEFGFDGVVMTDWIVGVMSGKGNRYAAPDAAKIAAAGNDLTMPGSQSDFRAMLRGLKNGTLKRRQLRVNATRVSRMARMLTSGHSVDISQGDRA